MKKRTKKGTSKAERIEQVIERLQDDMGVPGMCFTQKEGVAGSNKVAFACDPDDTVTEVKEHILMRAYYTAPAKQKWVKGKEEQNKVRRGAAPPDRPRRIIPAAAPRASRATTPACHAPTHAVGKTSARRSK